MDAWIFRVDAVHTVDRMAENLSRFRRPGALFTDTRATPRYINHINEAASRDVASAIVTRVIR